jgi:hypothetical protein
MNKMPEPIDLGKHGDTCMLFLHYHMKTCTAALASNETPMTVVEERSACCFPIPPFQRGRVWDRSQEIAFIESAWLGLPLGTFTFHTMDWEGPNAHPKPFSGWLIDGQQRLTAIERYWADEFQVFGARWSELSKQEVRRFMNIKFAHYEAAIWDEAKIRDLYNRLALGGTPHHSSERA